MTMKEQNEKSLLSPVKASHNCLFWLNEWRKRQKTPEEKVTIVRLNQLHVVNKCLTCANDCVYPGAKGSDHIGCENHRDSMR